MTQQDLSTFVRPAGKRGTMRAATAAAIVAGIAASAAAVAPTAIAAVSTVKPAVETQTFAGKGDIADDPAIWVDPKNPSKSLVVATSKAPSGGGVGVYDLNGKLLQFRKDGKSNNVDLRSGMVVRGKSSTVVAVTNRSTKRLVFYIVDPATRRLVPSNARAVGTGFEPYGTCMYQSKKSGKFYAFVSAADGGRLDQYELFERRGKLDARRVRTLQVGSQSEGCVADDESGDLYVAEEDKAIWKYGAEPSDGKQRTLVGRVGDGHLVADVEGLALAKRSDGSGHLIASSQGNSTYSVYDRQSNAWIKSFSIDGASGIDGVSSTDGLDVTTADLGPAFPDGLLVVHDNANSGARASNFKYVDLSQAIGTSSDSTVTPTPTPKPTPAPAPAPKAGDWWGWDPESTSVPPQLPQLPWHTNTGLFRVQDRAALVKHNGDFTTTRNNQVIDRMDITGDLVVKHSGVVVKRSWVHGRLDNRSAGPVTAIHIDLGDGKSGDYWRNGTRGDVHLYRSNVFGVTDAIQTAPGDDFVMQDNFIHDLRYAHHNSQPGGNTHNDGFQLNSFNAKGVIRHNTFWMWSMNNYSAKETATRSSGPHWTDKGGPLASTGYSAGSGSPSDGLVNAGIMVGSVKSYNPSLLIEGNLFRGHTYYDLNIQNGNVSVLNNTFSQRENVKGRNDVSGRSNIDRWSGNRSFETGKLLP